MDLSSKISKTGRIENGKKTLGIFIPERPDNHLYLDSDTNAIGCLKRGIRQALINELKNAEVRLVENLDFRKAIVQNGKVYLNDFCLNELDRFAWYCELDSNPGSFDLEVLKTLSRDVEVVRSPARFEIAMDKYQAHLALLDAGVSVAEFALFDQNLPQQMIDLLNEWGSALLKPRRGAWGKGVTLINSAESLRDIVGYIQSTSNNNPDHGFFLERYYENDPAKWASITMLNAEIMYGYRKESNMFSDLGDGKLKVQDSNEKGGGVVLADLTPQHVEEAHKAYEALGLGLIGFDMIWTSKGPVIIDENTSPGNYQDLYEQVEKDPAKLLANWVLNSRD